MRGFSSLAAAAFLFSFTAVDVASAELVTNAQQIQAGSYAVEPDHTQVAFSVLHFGFTNYQGVFSKASGRLTLDSRNPALSKLSVTIPIESVMTTSPKLDDELKGKEWFDSASFPNATFVSSRIQQTGKNEAVVTGNLTMHGITRIEVLKVRFIGAGINPMNKKYTAGFEADTTIKRSDFGIKMYVPYVSDDVHLHIAGAFEKQA